MRLSGSAGASGAAVVLTARSQDRLREAAATVDGEARWVAADLTSDEGTARLVEAVPDADVLVNDLGISAVVTPAEMIHHGVSETALLAVHRGFAKAAAGTGVTVNSVPAGPTRTGGVEELVRQLVPGDLPWEQAQQRFMREHRPQSLLQRLIEPEEIANTCCYLASPLASATTGAAVRVDGGYVDAILP